MMENTQKWLHLIIGCRLFYLKRIDYELQRVHLGQNEGVPE
jgi:hypothetical protein